MDPMSESVHARCLAVPLLRRFRFRCDLVLPPPRVYGCPRKILPQPYLD
jgi:hypothetical protein